MVARNHKLLLASVVLVVSAMCLEGLLGTSLTLSAQRRGETDTFDISATFTAVDAEGNPMAGASVYCSDGGSSFSSKGTTNSEGTRSFSESVALSSGDCPTRSVTRSCYAEKGSAKTETVSDTAEFGCRSATPTATPTSTSTGGTVTTPTSTKPPTLTTTPTSAPGVSTRCDSSCRSRLLANGGICATDVSGPKCYEDIEAPVRSKMPTGSNEQLVSWLPSSQSSGFYCEGDSTIKCFCYKLQDCGSDGCMSGKCVAPSGTPTPTSTPTPARGPACVDSEVASGMYDAKGTCTPATGKLCLGTGALSCTDLCNPDRKSNWVRKYYCIASGSDAGACGFSDYQCPGACQDGACLVCQGPGQSGSEACAAIGKSCISSTCGSGTCPNPTRWDAGPCDCTAKCA